MPPKKIAERWGNDHKNAILKGFRKCGWDSTETSGKNINAIIKSGPPAILSILSHISAPATGEPNLTTTPFTSITRTLAVSLLLNAPVLAGDERTGRVVRSLLLLLLLVSHILSRSPLV